MKLYKPILIFVLSGILAGLSTVVNAQMHPSYKVPEPNAPLIYNSDTLPVIHIPEVNIYDLNKFAYLRAWRYTRIIYNVKKAYPYAVIANHRLQALDNRLAQIDSKKDQREYMKTAEKEIMKEFEGQLKKLTISQGIILVKLIDREIGLSSYEVIQNIRGNFTAFFWQGIARLFGNDLKLQYDPNGEDQVIEDVILAIEQGFI